MRKRLAVLALLLAAPALADGPNGKPVAAPGGFVPSVAICTTGADGKASCAQYLPTSDANGASFTYNLTPAHMVQGTTYTFTPAARATQVYCASSPSQPLVGTLIGDGSGNGGAFQRYLVAGSSYDLGYVLYSASQIPAGCVLDLVR